MWDEALSIYQKDNLILLRDYPEDRHKIQDNYKSELFVIASKHKDPNVYTVHLMRGGPVHTVIWWQLFYLEKSSLGDSRNTDPTDSSPKTNLPFYQPKRIKQDNTPHQHPYGTRSKTQTSTILQSPNIDEDSDVETRFGSLVSSLFETWL